MSAAMIALLCFFLTPFASPLKPKTRLEAAAVRHQLIILRRKIRRDVAFFRQPAKCEVTHISFPNSPLILEPPAGGNLPPRQRRTNVWRKVTSPACRAKRLTDTRGIKTGKMRTPQ